MRLWIFSDLHLELSLWDLPTPAPECDVIVAAGDIHSPTSRGVEWLAEHGGGKPIVYVPGNHEWYSYKAMFNVVKETARAVELADKLGVHLLMDAEAVIGGVRFLGTTLWTDYALHGSVATAERVAQASINDHQYIFPIADMAPLTPSDARLWHHQSREWLEQQLAVASDLPTVVVTHHVPHPRSIDSQYTGSPLNPAFCSDLSELVEGSGAALWVHGHTHSSFDYQAGRSRVVCNPKGYGPFRPGGRIGNPLFDPTLVIDVECHLPAS